MDVSESYKPLAQAAHQTASGIFDASLYGREVAATQPVWDIRGEMDPLRREYLPQFESAEMAMTDPQRYAALQQLASDRAEALRDPETAALRLEGVDPAYLQGIQALREQQAAAGATAAPAAHRADRAERRPQRRPQRRCISPVVPVVDLVPVSAKHLKSNKKGGKYVL